MRKTRVRQHKRRINGQVVSVGRHDRGLSNTNNSPVKSNHIHSVNDRKDSPEAYELKIYIENDANLYRQRFLPIMKNLQRKKEKGIYNNVGATKLFTYLVNDGAKKYAKENNGTWNQMFSTAVRLETAREFEKEFSIEYASGNRW